MSTAPELTASLKPGIRFTETMRGYWTKGETDDYEAAAAKGKKEGSSFEFTLTIASEDLDDMLQNPEHPATMTGTANVPSLSPERMAVSD